MAKQLQEIDDTRRLTAHGTLYKALARMETAGLLESRWEDRQDGLNCYEAWLHSSHPDRYSELFAGPCCGSHPVFTGEMAMQQADLLDEWEAAAE